MGEFWTLWDGMWSGMRDGLGSIVGSDLGRLIRGIHVHSCAYDGFCRCGKLVCLRDQRVCCRRIHSLVLVATGSSREYPDHGMMAVCPSPLVGCLSKWSVPEEGRCYPLEFHPNFPKGVSQLVHVRGRSVG